MQLYTVQFDKNIVMHACMQGANLRLRKVPIAVMTARHQIPPSMSNHSNSLPTLQSSYRSCTHSFMKKMRHKEIEAFHPSCLSQTKESIRHLLSLTTTNHNYNVDTHTYTFGQIITVAAAVYHGEDSIVFALCVFNNRVFRLFRVARMPLTHNTRIFRLTYLFLL